MIELILTVILIVLMLCTIIEAVLEMKNETVQKD